MTAFTKFPTQLLLSAIVLLSQQMAFAQVLVDDIRVVGNSEISVSTILEVVTSRPGRACEEANVQRDVHAIYGLGWFTDVRPRLFRDPQGATVLEFTVQENPVVERVEFQGVELAEMDELRERMQTQPGQLLNFVNVASDKAVLERYYTTDLGYPHPQGHIRSIGYEEGALVVSVVETFVANKVRIEGVTFVDETVLASKLTCQSGQPVQLGGVDKDSSMIAAAYEDAGYVISGISHRLDEPTQTLVYEVYEIHVEDVRLAGNVKNRTEAILRRVRTDAGQPLAPQRLQRDMERLRSSGLFLSVKPEIEAGATQGGQVVTLDVEEDKSRSFVVGVGYQTGEGDANSGLSGQLSVSEQSLWGTGQAVGASWNRGQNQSVLSTSWSNPAWNSNGDGIGLTVYKSHYDNLQQSADENGNMPLYDDQRTGAVASYSRPLSDLLTTSAAVRYEDVSIAQEADSPAVVTGTGEGILSSMTLSAHYDSTNDLRNPTSGTRAQLAATGGAGEFNYTKLEGRLDRILPLTKSTELYLAGAAGTVAGDAPAGELFTSGGPRALRAYESAYFYGDKMVYGLAEYRFPLIGHFPVKGVVFAELGNAWYSSSPSKLAASSGVGARLAIPQMGLGDLQLNYAWGREGGRFSLGVGRSF